MAVRTEAVFTVALSIPSNFPVSVDFNTADGTPPNVAVAGSDYETTSGTVTFAPGETSRTIIVPIIDDVITEDDETFVVDLNNPTGATSLRFPGVATIVDSGSSALRRQLRERPVEREWVEDSQNDWFASTQRATLAATRPKWMDWPPMRH